MEYPLVSIIVLNYNGLRFLGEDLVRCLESVFKTDYPRFEVLFVDNGSGDGSPDFVRKKFKDPRLRIIENKKNLGFAGGNNVGIRNSRGEYIALLNNDIIVDKDWLREIIKIMKLHPKIGVAGCKIMIYGSANIIDNVGGKLSINGAGILVGHGEKDRGQYNSIRYDFDYVCGAAMVIKKDVFDKVGLFDCGYFLFYEETDFCYRVRRENYEIVYVPKAVVWHKHSATFKKIDPSGLYKTYMLHRQRLRFIIIHFSFLKILRALIYDYMLMIKLIFLKPLYAFALIKAYLWNLKKLSNIVKRRFALNRNG